MPVMVAPKRKSTPLQVQGRPCWVDFSNDVDLFYLGWGHRYYGKHNLKPSFQEGWCYVVILRGTPSLDLSDRSFSLKKGSVVVARPGCMLGWSDQEGAVSEVLYWIWKCHPEPGAPAPVKGIRLGTADGSQLDHLRLIHQCCRREVQIGDTCSYKALRGLHSQLDMEFTRIFNERKQSSAEELRFALAVNWLRANLRLRGAVTLLGDYLDMSAPALERLFRERAGCTPAQFLHSVRMRRAREMVIEEGMAAKTAAFELGYAHANDLSRAYFRYTGQHLCHE